MVDTYFDIATIDNAEEARLLKTILQERSIPHQIQPLHAMSMQAMSQAPQGWGCIQAPEEYRKMILYILSDLRKDANLA